MASGVHIASISSSFTVHPTSFSLTVAVSPLSNAIVVANRNGEITEVILATNPTAEGDATAHYISDRLRETGVKLSRIAYGLPLGGDIEYADHVTIGLSMQHRRGID